MSTGIIANKDTTEFCPSNVMKGGLGVGLDPIALALHFTQHMYLEALSTYSNAKVLNCALRKIFDMNHNNISVITHEKYG